MIGREWLFEYFICLLVLEVLCEYHDSLHESHLINTRAAASKGSEGGHKIPGVDDIIIRKFTAVLIRSHCSMG